MQNSERRAELVEHLAELRTRLVRIAVYLGVGMVGTWFLYDPIYNALTGQMGDVLHHTKTKYLFTSITEPFMLRMQVTFISALVVVLPLLTLELWGFISPGLTKEEKRPLRWTVPLAVGLFALGAWLCYNILPMAFSWFAYYVPDNAELRPSVPATIRFQLLMLLAFGCAFELPVVLMLLAQVGIVNSKMLWSNWRYAVVIISIVAATLTPSSDAFSMLSMAIPLVGLYFVSILLVKFVERKPKRE